MNFYFTFLLLCTISIDVTSQTTITAAYERTDQAPYGKINPEAPEQLLDFAPMIGLCDCKSQSRKADNSWTAPVNMTWKFKYIMNGMAIQDETIKEDGRHSGNIRQYSKDSARWYVHYYSSAAISTVLSTFEGNKKADDIILYRKQKAPNGAEGFYRLSFYDIDYEGFKWVGEWVDPTEKIIFPTWKIVCLKRKE